MSSAVTDSHVHSEWSWDNPSGSMVRACERAVSAGLPAIAFTELVDHTVFTVVADELDANHPLVTLSDAAGVLRPPPLDLSGYLESVQRCRELFPELRVLSGVELGEPHWHTHEVRQVLDAVAFDRVLGSLHCLPDAGGFREPAGLYGHRAAAEVLRDYLAEVAELVTVSDSFAVLAHIDYPVRSWPEDVAAFEPTHFEEEFRHALSATAAAGLALEVSTKLPLHESILRWWREEGGQAISFGSDAHDPRAVAQNFKEATRIAEAHGFREGQDPLDYWRLSS